MIYISVIIIAYNRSTYLKEAVDSVLNQTLERSLYEVIVVKNFNSELDDFLHKSNVKVLFSNERSIGPKLVMALSVCEGKIVAFLDDDDKFTKDKLLHIYDTYQSDYLVGYYRNNFEIIDSGGNVKNSYLFRESRSKIEKLLVTKIIDSEKTNKLGLMIDLSFEALPSCISVLKSILVKNQHFLNDLDLSQDWFSFFAALLSEYTMIADGEVLSQYRVHENNTSIKNNLTSMGQFHLRLYNSLETIKNMIDDKGSKQIIKVLDNFSSYHFSKYQAMLTSSKKFVIKETFYFVKRSIHFHIINPIIYINYLFIVFTLFTNHKISRELYEKEVIQDIKQEYFISP